MDDNKLFGLNEKELEPLIQIVRTHSQDIEIEFDIDKNAMLVMKSGKQYMTKGIILPNPEKIRTLGEKEIDKYLGILEADIIKQVKIRGKKKLKTRISGEPESYSRQNYIAATLSKG